MLRWVRIHTVAKYCIIHVLNPALAGPQSTYKLCTS